MTEDQDKIFYVTTPIYYPSDNLHIGHALTTTMADTLARFYRLKDYDVFFLTGSDEHGQKIERRAKEAGKNPQEFVDQIVAGFKNLWQCLFISYDDFIRTTEPRHIQGVQELFRKIYAKGDIYKAQYEGWYCTPCESFFTQRQLVDGNCPDCGRPVELLKEESYFFRMSKYADRLLNYIEEHPDFIQPEVRKNEMVSFIKSGLEDLCISRTTFNWGIPVPVDPNHVIYVWFDALANYITALGYGSDYAEKLEKYWPHVVHLVGKDILRFHTVIWPIILMAADLPLPKTVYGHGWLLMEGSKMSKSKGNVVDPLILLERYGADAIRYYLLREMPYNGDGYYSEEALVNRLNTDLANDFGNLVSRTTAMIEKFNDGLIPPKGITLPQDEALIKEGEELYLKVEEFLQNFRFAQALTAIMNFVNTANKYIEDNAPWALAKEEKKDRLHSVLYNLAEAIRIATVLLSPVLPTTLDKVWQQMGFDIYPQLKTWQSVKSWGQIGEGIKIRRGEPLFPRVVLTAEESEEQEKEMVNEIIDKKEDSFVSIEEFKKMDLRLAEVLSAEKVSSADKLLKLTLSLGEEKREVVAGIAQYYQPEELVGKKVVMIVNLQPAKIRGIESQGMILAAVDQENKLTLLVPEKDVSTGAKIR